MGHVAGGTKIIHVGAGGIMLPNHSPLVIAEQFGTLASLFPDRIDLGLGRAPGQISPLLAPFVATLLFLRITSLKTFKSCNRISSRLRRVKGFKPFLARACACLSGYSSLFSAQLAAELGLPFAFASHFAPADMMQALQLYRTHFKPSRQLDRPYATLGLNVVVAETDARARFLFTSVQQAFTNLRRGTPGQIPPPIEDIDSYWSPAEKASAGMALLFSAVGSPDTVERTLLKLIEVTQPDEIITTAHIYDHAARLRSFELLGEIRARFESADLQHAPSAPSLAKLA
jgi:luciferase family oxidoreductase group 1